MQTHELVVGGLSELMWKEVLEHSCSFFFSLLVPRRGHDKGADTCEDTFHLSACIRWAIPFLYPGATLIMQSHQGILRFTRKCHAIDKVKWQFGVYKVEFISEVKMSAYLFSYLISERPHLLCAILLELQPHSWQNFYPGTLAHNVWACWKKKKIALIKCFASSAVKNWNQCMGAVVASYTARKLPSLGRSGQFVMTASIFIVKL